MVKKLTQQEYITKAIAKHGERNDYSKTTYVNMRTKIIYLCKKCNKYKTQTAHGHLVSGCEKCSYDERGLSRRSNIEEFIEKAVKVHEIDKNRHGLSDEAFIEQCKKPAVISTTSIQKIYTQHTEERWIGSILHP